jgi:hypothetical protein
LAREAAIITTLRKGLEQGMTLCKTDQDIRGRIVWDLEQEAPTDSMQYGNMDSRLNRDEDIESNGRAIKTLERISQECKSPREEDNRAGLMEAAVRICKAVKWITIQDWNERTTTRTPNDYNNRKDNIHPYVRMLGSSADRTKGSEGHRETG